MIRNNIRINSRGIRMNIKRKPKINSFAVKNKMKNEMMAIDNSFDEAIKLYSTKKDYNKIVKHNMLCDFSWKNSAEQYVKLYKQL